MVIVACGEDKPRSPLAPALAPMSAPLGSDFRQCANNAGAPFTLGSCDWINSILQGNNSKYVEGMSTPQRLIISNIPTTTADLHTLQFHHQAIKSTAHAYDFLTSWDQAVAAAGLIAPGLNFLTALNPCGPDPTGSAFQTACNSLRTSGNLAVVSIPDAMGSILGDNVGAAVAAYETKLGSDRTLTIYGNHPFSGSAPALAFNGYDAKGNADYTLTWTSTSDSVLIEFAGHIAVGTDPL